MLKFMKRNKEHIVPSVHLKIGRANISGLRLKEFLAIIILVIVDGIQGGSNIADIVK